MGRPILIRASPAEDALMRQPLVPPVGPDERAVYQAVRDAGRLTQEEIAETTGVRGRRLDNALTALLLRQCLQRLGAGDVYGVGPLPLPEDASGPTLRR
jgi:hypothetical protein